ncbi:hypothetical protein EYF80_037860 [Liparis tanakae]|uniref:Uncharacterized protein n=1 Tax=Liparis tanakae TaxID=230148 RepID=A0A4Z2GGD3_9TELE|nr:hypothetical protein EYF80_037860 [Liparis tanakae]
MEEITSLWTSKAFVLQANSRASTTGSPLTHFSCRILLSSSSSALPCSGRVSSLPRPRPRSPGVMTGSGSGRLRLFS